MRDLTQAADLKHMEHVATGGKLYTPFEGLNISLAIGGRLQEYERVLRMWENGAPSWAIAEAISRWEDEMEAVLLGLAIDEKIKPRWRGAIGWR